MRRLTEVSRLIALSHRTNRRAFIHSAALRVSSSFVCDQAFGAVRVHVRGTCDCQHKRKY